MKSITRPWSIVRVLLCLVPFVGVAVMVYGWPFSADHDIFLHLKTGEVTWKTGSILRHDVFTFTEAGKPDECHSWLSQVLFYLLHDRFGEAGIRWLNLFAVWFVLGCIGWYLWKRTRDLTIVFLGLCVALGIHTSVQQFRPLFLGEALFSMMLCLILTEAKALSWPKLIFSAIVTVLWANLHGSVVILPPLFAIYAAFLGLAIWERRRESGGWEMTPREWISLASPFWVFGLTCINAMGIGLYHYTLELSAIGRNVGINEWKASKPLEIASNFPSHKALNISLHPKHVVITLLPFIAILFLRDPKNRSSRALPMAYAVAISALAWYSYRHGVYVLFASAVLLIWVADRLPRIIPHPKTRSVLVVAYGFLVLYTSNFHQSGMIVPTIDKASQFLKEVGVQANVINSPNFASQLIYNNYPDIKVSNGRRTYLHRRIYEYDNRVYELYGVAEFDSYLEMFKEGNLFMFEPALIGDMRRRHPNWVIVFENNHATIGVRRGDPLLANFVKYYQDHNVPFDPEKGFDPRLAFEKAPDWSAKYIEVDNYGNWPMWGVYENLMRTEKSYYEARKIPMQIEAE